MGYMRTPFRWWTGLSPRRRVLLGALAVAVAVAAVVTGVRVSGGPPEAVPGRPGAVLLVPGYGGCDHVTGRAGRADPRAPGGPRPW